MLKLIVIIHSTQLSLHHYAVTELRQQLPSGDNCHKFQVQTIRIIIFSIVENSADKVHQRLRNKISHLTYGNIKEKTKEKKYIKITNWNKANSDFETHINAIKHHVAEEDSTIFVISQSNVKKEDDLDA